jgi:predicted permease
MRPRQLRKIAIRMWNKHQHCLAKQKVVLACATLEMEDAMLPVPAPERVSWTPVLITIGTGILLAIVSFAVITSQWGNPQSNVATAGFVGILLGILIFVAGCIWLLVKILGVMSQAR